MARWLFLLAATLVLAAAEARAAPPLDVYGKLPGIEDVAMSPSGDCYAMIALVGDSRKLLVFSGGAVIAAAEVGKAKVREIWWAGEDHVLVEISATAFLGLDFTIDRDELVGVTSLNVRTGKLTPIFANDVQIAQSVWGVYGEAQIAGHWYGYFGGVTFETTKDPNDVYLRNGLQYPDLYQVDLDTGHAHMVAHGSETIDGWLVGPDGAVIAHQTYDPRSQYWTVEAGGVGGKLLDSGHAPFGGPGVSRGRTADAILVSGPDDASKDGQSQEISLATGKASPVPDSETFAGTLTDRETGLWIGVVKEGDRPETSLFDPLMDARAKGTRKAFPADQNVRFEGWNRDFSRLIVFTTGAGDPGTYWIVDIKKGTADPFGYQYPAIGDADVGPIRMVDWKAADGLPLQGVLSLPPDRPAKDLPVVVLPHGGPEARDYPVFNWWAQAFASQGYAVFQPNFRGSSGYGVKFRDAGFGEFGRKMQTDVSDGLSELAREGVVDPKRACIVGGSYGGYAALAGVTLQHGLYRCSVAVAGISDLDAFMSYVSVKDNGWFGPGGRYFRSFVGAHPNDVSPIRFASRADAPILLIHGKDDTVVPFDQSQRMEAALKAAGKPVQLVVMPNEDHWLSREETRELMLKSAVAFVEANDPPDPPPPAAAP